MLYSPVLYNSKHGIFVFLTVGQTKQEIRIRLAWALGDNNGQFHYFLTFKTQKKTEKLIDFFLK